MAVKLKYLFGRIHIARVCSNEVYSKTSS